MRVPGINLYWLRNYRRAMLSDDLVAALLVTLLLIPQSLAYAALAGLPPQVGLYASVLPLIAYAIIGSSMILSVGPVAIISLMTATALAPVAAPGSPEYVAAAIVLAVLSGAMLFAAGLLRLGQMAQFLSHPVISGFISGAALMIIIGQLPPLLGIEIESQNAVGLALDLLLSLQRLDPLTSILGIATLVFLASSRLWMARLLARLGVPENIADLSAKLMPIVAVFGTIALVTVRDWQEHIDVVGTITPGLPSLVLPEFRFELINSLWLPALVISVVGFIESVSIAQAFAISRNQRIDPDAELRGLGIANIFSGMSGAFPISGGFSRSAVNADAGARSPLSGVFAALLIALVLLFLTGLFSNLPIAVLAATIIVAASNLIDIRKLRRTWHYDPAEGLALAGTAGGVLVAGVETGIALGVGLSLATLVWRASKPHIAVLGRLPGTEQFRKTSRYKVETNSALIFLRVDENLFFGNADAVEQRIERELARRNECRELVLVMSAVSSVDATAEEMLIRLNARLVSQGRRLHVAEVKGPVLERLEHGDLLQNLSGDLHLSAYAAFVALQKQTAAKP